MPVFVAALITETNDTPAWPTRTFTLDGAAAPAEQLVVASVMAICAWEIVWGVVSINGKAAPGAKPASKELSAMNWLSSPWADAFLVGYAMATAEITNATRKNTKYFRRFIEIPPMTQFLIKVNIVAGCKYCSVAFRTWPLMFA